MTIEVKNSIKPLDYVECINMLEKRVEEVLLGRKNELLWILEHKTVYTGGTSSNEKDKKRHKGTIKRSEGKLKKRKNELDVQLKRIDNNKMMDSELVSLCEGLIIIE